MGPRGMSYICTCSFTMCFIVRFEMYFMLRYNEGVVCRHSSTFAKTVQTPTRTKRALNNQESQMEIDLLF